MNYENGGKSDMIKYNKYEKDTLYNKEPVKQNTRCKRFKNIKKFASIHIAKIPRSNLFHKQENCRSNS